MAETVRTHLPDPAPSQPAAAYGPDSADTLMSCLYGGHVLRAAFDLGVADALGEDEAAPAATLAARVGAVPGMLDRLMRALVALRVFGTAPDGGGYVHTTVSLGMRRTSAELPNLLGAMTRSPALEGAWRELAAGLRTGACPFELANGASLYAHLDRDPHLSDVFRGFFGEQQTGPALLRALRLSEARTVVDVGGSDGSLLRDVLRHGTHLSGVLFDLPDAGRHLVAELRGGPLADRFRFEAGDIRVSVPPGDLYLLRLVLHNWDDPACVAILSTIARTAAPGARVAVLEETVPEGAAPSPSGALADLDMFTLCGGAERTAAEYRALCERAGLTYDGVDRVPPWSDIVHATVPGPGGR